MKFDDKNQAADISSSPILSERGKIRKLVNFNQGSLLSAPPEKLETNWIVFTGPQCAGKTTVINLLAKSGYLTQPEVARQYAKKLFQANIPKQQIHANWDVVQDSANKSYVKKINEMLQFAESSMIWDRGLGDMVALTKLARILRGEGQAGARLQKQQAGLSEWSQKVKYQKVLFFEALPNFIDDGLRLNPEKEGKGLVNFAMQEYQKLGYQVITIPALPIKERMEIIFSVIS